MSRYCSLEETVTNQEQKSVSKFYSGRKILAKEKSQAKLDKTKNFDIWFGIFFTTIAQVLFLDGRLGVRVFPNRNLRFS